MRKVYDRYEQRWSHRQHGFSMVHSGYLGTAIRTVKFVKSETCRTLAHVTVVRGERILTSSQKRFEVFMTAESSLRPWRDIAKELGQETNAERILELCEELTAAMQAQQGKKIEQAISSALHCFKPNPSR